jgi:superfamily II DNA or RNA helicase
LVDPDNAALARLFGKNLIRPSFEGNAVRELQKRGVLSKIDRRVIDSGQTVHLSTSDVDSIRTGFDINENVLKKLAVNRKRNELLVELLKREIESGRPAVVFTCSRSHAALLAAWLNLKGIRAAYVDCEMEREDRGQVIRRYKLGEIDVLFNFGVLTTGFDAPRTRTVVVARPTTSVVLYAQMIGRALRGPLMGGGEKSRLIDVRDNFEKFGGVDAVYAVFDEYWK